MTDKNKKDIDYKTLLNNLLTEIPENVYFKDIESKFIMISNSMAKYFGISDTQKAIGKTDADFFATSHAEKAFRDEQMIIKTGRPIIDIEEEVLWPNGRVTIGLTSKMPIHDKSRTVIGTFGVTRDITEQKRLETELKRLTSIDGLTGLTNRRRFNELLEYEWIRSMRSQSWISLLMIDVDHFKLFNDNYGHLSGDSCLKSVAEAFIQAIKRRTDLVARYGGEEFVIILPQTNIEGARMVAEKIHQEIRELRILHDFSPVEQFLSVSIGVSSIIPKPKESPLQLVLSADNALYEAKQSGRNRTCFYVEK